MRGYNLADPTERPPPPCSGRGIGALGLIGADDECSAAPTAFLSCPWLRTCSAAEKSAPSPTLHYDKSRQAGKQAAVPLAHHSTASFSVGEQTHKAANHTAAESDKNKYVKIQMVRKVE